MSRRRSRNRGKSQSQGQNQQPAQSQKKNPGQRNNRKSEPKVDPVEFWGDPDAMPEPIDSIDQVGDVKAVVRSLGRVPITGQETAAEHWFSLVYERAAVLAGALAAAGGLHGDDDTDELASDTP